MIFRVQARLSVHENFFNHSDLEQIGRECIDLNCEHHGNFSSLHGMLMKNYHIYI